MHSSEFSKTPRLVHSGDDAVPRGKIFFGGLHLIGAGLSTRQASVRYFNFVKGKYEIGLEFTSDTGWRES